MQLFNKLQGAVRSPPGLEHRIWRRLPAILLWGTLAPLLLAAVNHALAPERESTGPSDPTLLLWDYTLFGFIILHWTLVLTLALGCFIVRVMKGPAYVADAYPMPAEEGASKIWCGARCRSNHRGARYRCQSSDGQSVERAKKLHFANPPTWRAPTA
jgi:hypothetical protein